MGNATGFKCNRHADALAINMYPSRGMGISGFEIKVSRPDLMKELSTPDKAEEIARFCNDWWLVVPDGLIKDTDILPPAWGLMICKAGVLRVSKKAAPLKPQEVTKEFLCAVLRAAGKLDDKTIQAIKDKERSDIRQDNERTLNERVERETKRFQEVRDRIAAFEKITGLGINEYTNVEGLAEKIKNAQQIEHFFGRYSDLQTARRAAQKFVKETDSMFDKGVDKGVDNFA